MTTSFFAQRLRGLAICLVIALTTLPSSARADHGANAPDCTCIDVRNFDVGSRVSVELDYQSFFESEFPQSQAALENSIRNAIANLRQMSGINLDLAYVGIISSRQPQQFGTIRIKAQDSLGGLVRAEATSVSAGGVYGISTITFSMLLGRGPSKYNWVMTSDYIRDGLNESFPGVLIHELGHSLGLAHNNAGGRSMMNSITAMDFAPYHDDVEDLQALYGTVALNLSYRHARDHLGSSWGQRFGMASVAQSSSMPVSVIFGGNTSWVLLYLDSRKRPQFVRSTAGLDNFAFTTQLFQDPSRSLYGVSGHAADANSFMATWVSMEDHTVKVFRSSNAGVSWQRVSPDNTSDQSLAYGTPAIHHLGSSTWIVAYPKRIPEATDIRARERAHSGKVVARITTNNGTNWGPEFDLAPDLKALRGASIAASGRDDIRIGFPLMHTSSNNRVAVIQAKLDASNNLILRSTRVETNSIRAYPEVSLLKTHSRTGAAFVMGYRGFFDEIIVRDAPFDSLGWSDRRIVSSASAQAPTKRIPVTLGGNGGDSLYMFSVGE